MFLPSLISLNNFNYSAISIQNLTIRFMQDTQEGIKYKVCVDIN